MSSLKCLLTNKISFVLFCYTFSPSTFSMLCQKVVHIVWGKSAHQNTVVWSFCHLSLVSTDNFSLKKIVIICHRNFGNEFAVTHSKLRLLILLSSLTFVTDIILTMKLRLRIEFTRAYFSATNLLCQRKIVRRNEAVECHESRSPTLNAVPTTDKRSIMLTTVHADIPFTVFSGKNSRRQFWKHAHLIYRFFFSCEN